MRDPFALDPVVAGVVLGMAAVTYATKAGGLWALGRLETSSRTEAALQTLPGAVLVALVGPELLGSSPAELGAAAVVAVVAWKTDSVALALAAGVGSVLLLRTV